MKVIKTIIPIIAIILLCGCNNKEVTIDDDIKSLTIFCDKQYGVEYIRDVGIYRGGITVRLDEKGNVIHCEKGDE